jgi:hypothetical protein
MGWGIILNNVYANGATMSGLDNEIEELQDEVRTIETKIALMIGAPVKANNTTDLDGGEMGWDEYLPYRLQNMFYEYKEAVNRLYLLELIRDADEEDVIADN